ncbi:MAG: GerMN domain-containing protein [Lachnospiraceae bacterium]|nr:GerMN domain-containing protein [Lachnospiraceae bacterium]
MKKRLIVCLLCIVVLGTTACGNQNIQTGSMESQNDNIDTAESEQKEELPQEETVKVNIYYSPVGTARLDSALEEVKGIKPETIISRLCLHNIVSIDTRVLDFIESKEMGKNVLTLNLNKAFGEYLNTMGIQSEEIIMAALTNTFLEAYGADAILVLVDGKALKTMNHSYEEPLVFTKLESTKSETETAVNSEEFCVERVEDDSIAKNNDQIHIVYPRIVGPADEEVLKAMNTHLKEYALSLYEFENTEQLSCDYEVTYVDGDEISIVFRGTMKWKGNEHQYSYAASFNFDLANGQYLRPLTKWDMEELADRLLRFEHCEMLSDMEVNTFIQQLQMYYPKLEEALEKFDFDFDEVLSVAQGYSYRSEDGVGLIIPVSDDILDYVEVKVLTDY